MGAGRGGCNDRPGARPQRERGAARGRTGRAATTTFGGGPGAGRAARFPADPVRGVPRHYFLSMTRADVLIVGGGASGTLLAAQLLRRARGPLRVVWADRHGAFARGLAYGAARPMHVLNVPAAGMSALPDEPDHFRAWCTARGVPAAPGAFLPRRLYGAYLADLYAAARREAARRVRIDERAVGVERIVPAVDGYWATFDDGGEVLARQVVLACGNAPSTVPLDAAGRPCAGTIDAWDGAALDRLDPDRDLLLLGTGLTMVDVAVARAARGGRGRLLALSRHGLLPRPHDPAAGPPRPLDLPDDASIRALLRAFRAQAGADWRAAIDGLRPLTQALWQRLPLAERRRFLRHLRPWWDVHRHRLPPDLHRRLGALQETGRLTVHAGRVLEARRAGEEVVVRWRPRGGGAPRTEVVAAIVRCTGPATEAAADPLLRRLVADGLASPDPLGLGVRTVDGVVHRHGAARLRALGPMLRGERFETTAIPEIRAQAAALAARLLEECACDPPQLRV